MVKYIFFTVCLLGSLFATRKSGYHILLKISGDHSDKVVLALVKSGNIEVIDSLPLLKKGSYHFKGNQSLAPGQYAFIQNKSILFHFLVSFEQKTALQFYAKMENGRTTELIADGDAENKAYTELSRFIQDANHQSDFSNDDLMRIDQYTDSIAQQYPNTLLAIISRNISTPPLPQNMSLHDRRVLNTSILPVRIRSFFSHIVPPQPAFVLPQIDSILTLCTDPAVKDWCGAFLLNYFLSSNIMGMENAAVYIAQKYLDGEIKTQDSNLIQELTTYVLFNEQSLIGMPAPELSLPDSKGHRVSLRNVNANYIILLFYDEDCPICREEVPKIDLIYQQFKSNHIEVYAVYTQDRYEAWQEYVHMLNPEWIHVWDPDFSSGFHKLYNVTGTPKLYLLDRDKTIIGRGLDANVLRQILSYQLETVS